MLGGGRRSGLLALGAVAACLRARLRAPVLRAQLGAGGADLAQILPELRERLPDLPEPPAGEPETARFRLFEAAAGFVRAAAASRAVVLVLDDLHAADTPSLLLLRFLARELAGARVLLVGACRDVDPTPGRPLTELLTDVAREPAARRLSLGGLSERELAEYVELTARQIASPELAAALHEETEGNPLFAGEIVRLLAVEGVWSRSGAQTPFAIPETVRDVISRRLAHLSEPCRRALAHASVLGREPAIDALARMAGLGEGELLDVLDEAMAARVIADVPGVPGRVRFAHALIRDTLYDGLTGARRVRLHRRALEVLEALYGPDLSPRLAELAHHALAGSDVAEGVRYARLAGDRALALLAYEEAARLYESALAALGDSGEGTRCELCSPSAKPGHRRATRRARSGRSSRRPASRGASGSRTRSPAPPGSTEGGSSTPAPATTNGPAAARGGARRAGGRGRRAARAAARPPRRGAPR